ncbi:McrB family protein [Chryseobacterium indologenes]|uniref:McrB family protein n=1 Tax=Chryseobacterium indologenes TaxID=253 RepID=UPI000764BF91|nr:AAA family ATPase [Chryseobacterium indologenes]
MAVRKLKTNMTFTELIDKIEIWNDWRGKYNRFVPQFVSEASTGKNWEDWDQDIFYEFFMRPGDQCVSSLKQGYFTHEERDLIKEKWSELSVLLQKIAISQEHPLFDTYYQIKELIRKCTYNNKKAATNRLIASLQPQLLCTIVNEDKLRGLIYLLNKNVEDFELKLTYDWFQDSYTLLQIFKEKLNKDVYEIVTLPWQVYDYFQEQNTPSSTEQNDMSENTLDHQIQILDYKKQIILQGPPGTGKTRMARELAVKLLGLPSTEELKDNPQFKLIQFHPSYSYEDFVRGIVAESKGEKIEYKNVNKTLGLFTEEALRNYKASTDISSESNIEIWIDTKFEEFKTNIEAKLPEEEVVLSGDIKIYDVTNSYFKYGKSWQTPGYLKFSEFKKLVKAIVLGEFELSNKQLDKDKFIHAHYRYTYYNALLRIFFDEYQYQGESYNETLQNYVLVIDEINRANLSSVLGELIYALEYRGEAVNSMYEVEDSILADKNHLILPPNLYIIGTMNTADRSVGHIDYAIRRRFAFIEVLPEPLEDDDRIHFNTEGFKKVSNLFKNGNVSGEFEAKDIQLGHSYFIAKKEDIRADQTKEDIFNMKMDYEVVPILLEYVKDGVLIGTFEDKEDNNKKYEIKDYINTLKTNN